MRILHIFDHSIPLHSGYSFRSLAILKEQRALGWETNHLTGPKHSGECDADPEEVVDGLHFFRTPRIGGLVARLPVANQLAVMTGLQQRLEEVVRMVKPDILHAHSPVLNGIPAIRIGSRYQIPVVYEVRAFWEDAAVDHGSGREGGLRYRLTRAMETYALKRAGAVTTICHGLRDDIIARGVSAESVTVIPNAVDLNAFSAAGVRNRELAKQLGLDGKRVLGFIGSFYAYEGLPLLLRALPMILSRYPSVRILLVGGGPDEARLRRLAVALGVEAEVIFTGRVSHDRVQDYYNLIDVLVYPRISIRLTELVTPLKPLEAMAQGRLLIASDIGGHRELISNGKTGVLFRAGDVDDLADKIAGLLDRNETWADMRRSARDYVETERNWPMSVSRYRRIYGRLAGKGGGEQ